MVASFVPSHSSSAARLFAPSVPDASPEGKVTKNSLFAFFVSFVVK